MSPEDEGTDEAEGGATAPLLPFPKSGTHARARRSLNGVKPYDGSSVDSANSADAVGCAYGEGREMNRPGARPQASRQIVYKIVPSACIPIR
jgi:hypothetical protein